MFNFIKKLIHRKRKFNIEPLLHSNAERLFEEWSSGFGISMPLSDQQFLLKDIAGNYAIKGNNPKSTGGGYFGTLSLKPNGSLVKAYWEIGHTRQPQYGMGFVRNNLIALDFYYSEEGTRYYGQVIYRVDGDRLIGFWRENHVGEIAVEEATLKNRLV